MRVIRCICLLLLLSLLLVACAPDSDGEKEGESKAVGGFSYPYFLSVVRDSAMDTATLTKGENGETQVCFSATGYINDHVSLWAVCAPTQTVQLEFYGKAEHVAYDASEKTGAMLIVDFYDAAYRQIGHRYNAYVLSANDFEYHRYSFIAPHGTKQARFCVVTRADTDVTLHSLTASIFDGAPTSAPSEIRYDAHLGAILSAPRNTLPAFELAAKAGFTYCITNCNWTKDGVLVALHNDTIDATSNGTGSVHDMTYEELLQYDFGAWFHETYAGTKIPTLEQVVALMASEGVVPIFRLHNAWSTEESRAYLAQIHTWIEQYGWQGKAGVKAFSRGVLNNAYAVMGDDVEYLLCGELSDKNLSFYDRFEGHLTIEFPYANFDREATRAAAARGVRLSSYTVNDVALMREMIACGVKRFCTDTHWDMVYPQG